MSLDLFTVGLQNSDMHHCHAFPFVLTLMTLNDLELPKIGIIVNFFCDFELLHAFQE